MPNAVSENRSPAFVPLTLAWLVLILSGAFVLIGALTTPPQALGQLSGKAQFAQWFGSIGLLFGFVLLLGCALVERRGVPARAWTTVLVALVLIFGLGVAWSMAQSEVVSGLLKQYDRQQLLIWMAAFGAVKVIVINAIALPVAWRLGGRGETPVLWQPWHRRVLGALIAASLCAGVLLLVQTVAAGFTSLGSGEERVGMSVVALGVGTVHGLFALILPMRRGSGAMPALVSSLLTPVLIVLASLPAVAGGTNWDMAGRITVVLMILIFAPMLTWTVVRWVHGRGARR
ncbi:MAG: hypothetical protein ACREP7_17695 [Lysobacter sp.]